MRRALASGVLAAVAVLAAGAPAGHADDRGSSSIKWEEGGRAPADTWGQEDGCPARTGATETDVFLGPKEVAWRFGTQGEIEGEPLAWGARIVVVERAGP